LNFVNPETDQASYPYKVNNWKTPAQLRISEGLNERWLQPSFAACNRLPGIAGKWTASYVPEDQMSESAMFGSNYYSIAGNQGGDGQWKSVFNIPEPQEYPIEFYNRIVGAGQESTIMGVGVPKLPALQLCEDVIKVCEPGTGSALTSGTSAVNTGGTTPVTGGCVPGLFSECDQTGYVEPPVTTTTTTGTPVTAPATGTPATAATTSAPRTTTTTVPTVVPSVTTPSTTTTNQNLNDLF
jgi:hypothetical protein